MMTTRKYPKYDKYSTIEVEAIILIIAALLIVTHLVDNSKPELIKELLHNLYSIINK
jgi:hypothetical protein